MKYNHIYILSFFFILLLTSCCKNEPEPPEPPAEPMLTAATKEGKHTLSFLLDDEVWVSDRGIGDLSASIAINSKRLAISSRKTTDEKERLTFSLLLNNFIANKYYLNQNDSNNILFARSQAINDCAYDFGKLENDTFNIVNITWLDNEKRHIAGTFNLRMVDQTQGCIDTLYITDGRFDLQFQTTP